MYTKIYYRINSNATWTLACWRRNANDCDITSGALDGRASDVHERCSLCAACRPGEWLWVDSNATNGKPTFRRHARLPTSRDFPRFVFISQISRPESEVVDDVHADVYLLWKRPLTGKFSKIVFRKDSPPLRSTYCVRISWNFADWKSVKSRVAYQTKKFRLTVPLSLLRGSRPKSIRQYAPSALNFIQIRSLPAEL